MQAWMVPGTPLVDGWHLWYGTDGTPPQAPRVTQAGKSLTVDFHAGGPLRLEGFPRTLYRARLRVPTDMARRPSYEIDIPETGERHTWATLPENLPTEGLALIFGSCFWQPDDADGALLRACRDILALEVPRPTFKLLLGDQIYLDWPPDIAPWRLRQGGYRLVGERYQRYWGDEAYREFLGLLPNLMVPDDHEFWNDYPEPQIQLPVTWQKELRDDFASAAREYFHAFQAGLSPHGGEQAWTIVPLAPASLFVADVRSERSRAGHHSPQLMSQEQWSALESWQHGLQGPGLLALGQPVFQPDGDFRDHSLSNFPREFRRLLALLRRSARGENAEGTPHNIVLLSGDIHHSRSTYALIPGVDDPDFRQVHELVSSASSTIGPYLTQPKAAPLPEFLPPGGADPDFSPRWPVEPVRSTAPFQAIPAGGLHACVDNNIGVLRLRPHPLRPYKVELTHVTYRVRAYHRPYIQWPSQRSAATEGGTRLIHSHTLNLR